MQIPINIKLYGPELFLGWIGRYLYMSFWAALYYKLVIIYQMVEKTL